MKDLLAHALDHAHLRQAQYADIRVVQNQTEFLVVKNGQVEALETSESLGFGVRVLIRGAWGFAASRELDAAEVDQVTERAVGIALASAKVPGEVVDLGPPVTSRGVYHTPVQIDPFSVPLEDKLAVLLAADAEMAKVAGIRVRRGNLTFIREKKWFANSEGALTEQMIVEAGGGIQAVAVGNSEVQTRSYPSSFGRQQVTAGWEAVVEWDLAGNAARVATEAAALLTADPCPGDITTTIILGGDQVALQVHESCGHPIELDRVFGSEAAYAGTSFLTPEKLHNFRYGSEVVNLTADSSRPLGLGTFGWDDEGVPAQSTPIVKDGLFVGYLMSRETASRLGLVSNGCMRASSWNRLPIIRMTNVSLEPGEWELEELIADTDDGIYMETNRSWSIDDRRYNFQFGTEVAYEIKNGRLGRLLRNPTYTGITPEFWNNCDAVGNARAWKMYGTPNCGKGQPGQIAHTGHGAAPARFRNVRVGVLRLRPGKIMLTQQKIKNLCHQIFQRCGKDPAEVVLIEEDKSLTRFANNAIHQNVAESNLGIYLRLHLGQRMGQASTSRSDPEGLDRLVAHARANAAAGQENPHHPGLTEPAPIQEISCFDQATAVCSPDERAVQVASLCRAANEKGLSAAGAYATGQNQVSVANSQGVFALHAWTEADFQTVVMAEDASGRAQASTWRAADLNPEALGREAIAKAEAGRNPRAIEPGEYAVVADTYVTEDLLHMLNLNGMGGQAVLDGRSWMNTRLGVQAMSPSVDIWDDGLDIRGLPLPFDFEGVPKRRVDIVSGGVIKGPVYDRMTAEKAGETSTGHALPPNLPAYMRGVGPIALNLFMAPGRASLEEMIASTRRGLYITRFWYTRLVHPSDCVVTGMTRDGVYFIEDGEIAYPVKNLRFTQSYVQALAGVEMVSRETRLLKTEYGSRALCVPALKLASFHFTGRTV